MPDHTLDELRLRTDDIRPSGVVGHSEPLRRPPPDIWKTMDG